MDGLAPVGSRVHVEEDDAFLERARFDRRRIDALADAIAETAAHVDAATHRLLSQIREFDEEGGWHAQGALSCAHWLSWRIGLSPGAAREKVRVARALGELPLIDAALSRGEVSYCKVRAMTRVATEETEGALLEMSHHATGAEMEKICRLYRAVTSSDDEATEDDRRYVTARATDNGMVRITAVVTAEESERILKAIDTAAERVSAETRGRGEALSRADGLAHIAEGFLRGDVPERSPVEVVVTTPRAALSKEAGVSAETPHDESHVDRRAMRKLPQIEGTPVSAETARRLACDAGVVEVKTDEHGTPLDVGRMTRTISPALRRALKLRDGGCSFPGCSNHRFVDAHHIVHWADGGETKAENLVLLCRAHHTLLHEGGFQIQAENGTFLFLDAAGRRVPHTRRRPRVCLATLLRAHRARGLRLDPNTNMPTWSGKPPDYSACIDALAAIALRDREQLTR